MKNRKRYFKNKSYSFWMSRDPEYKVKWHSWEHLPATDEMLNATFHDKAEKYEWVIEEKQKVYAWSPYSAWTITKIYHRYFKPIKKYENKCRNKQIDS